MITSMSYAETWKPYQFQKAESYEFKVVFGGEGPEETENGSEPIGKEITYVLGIRNASGKEGFVEVAFTTKSLLKEEELNYEKVFGFGELIGVPLSILIINPMYSYFFEQIDLNVGERVKLLEIGTIKVTGKEKVGEREGYICQFFQLVEDTEELVTEWVIDPKLALPLRAKNFKEEKLESSFELISYKKVEE